MNRLVQAGTLAALTLLCVTASAQNRHWTMAEIIKMKEASSPVISPNGKYVAFTVKQPDVQNSKWNTQIWLAATDGSMIRQMTTSAASCTQPGWSPDSKRITFISRREHLDKDLAKQAGTPQLFAIPVDGGEAQALTSLEEGVDEYCWSKDGKYIAILNEEPLPEEAEAEMKRRADKRIDAIVASDPKPGKAIWILDIASGEAKKLKAVDAGVAEMDFAPDGRTIVYQTNYTGEYNDEQKFDIWTIDMDGKQKQLTSEAGPETSPKYSPDGNYIAYKTQTVPDIEFAETDLCYMKSDGTEKTNLTQYFDYSIGGYVWYRNSASVILLTNELTYNGLYMVKRSGGKWIPLVMDLMPMTSLTTSLNGTFAFTLEGQEMLREVATYFSSEPGTLPAERKTLTSFTSQLQGLPLGKQEVIKVPSRDGKFTIDAILIKPVDYKEGKSYPLLLAYHGGPFGNFVNKRMQSYPTNILAEKGVMIVMPNVRGSSGYTDVFGKANRYDLGGGDYNDAMDVVNYLIAAGMADSSRMGVMGGSYGGYMTNWTISQTQRFKAAVSLYGIFSWFTDWSNSWQPVFEPMYFGYNYWEKPIDMNSLWVNRAPQTFVQNIVTPTLILHGTEDVYTNLANSREMYAALKGLGRTVEFVTYPRAEHGLRTEPNQFIDAMDRAVEWLAKYMDVE